MTDPSVSTAPSARTTAPRRAIRLAPAASDSDTTAGRDSGTAATARLTAVTRTSSQGWPRSNPSPATSRLPATARIASIRPSPAIRRCSGGGGDPDAADQPGDRAVGAIGTGRDHHGGPGSVGHQGSGVDHGPAIRHRRPAFHGSRVAGGRHRLPGQDRLVDGQVVDGEQARVGRDQVALREHEHVAGNDLLGRDAAATTVTTDEGLWAVNERRASIAPIARRSWSTPTAVLTQTTRRMTPASARSPVTTVSAPAASKTRIIASRS
jgi:hypothetical protein